MIIMDINTQYKSNINVNDINFDQISSLFKTISEKISNYDSIYEIIDKIK